MWNDIEDNFIEIYEKNFFFLTIFNAHCIWSEMEEWHCDKLDIQIIFIP